MKQTAVEYMYSIMFEKKGRISKEEFEQAKTMEKEQVKDAWFDGVTNWDSEKEVEDYIKETFKSE